MRPLPAVPRRWPGSPIICLGAGPSVQPEDLTDIEASGFPVIAINGAARFYPAADVLYASDMAWWAAHPELVMRSAMKFTFLEYPVVDGVVALSRTGQTGLELNPQGLKSGGHSGYAAANLAFHLGASRIILVGYDMRPDDQGNHHAFHMEHPDGSHPRYAQWIPLYVELRARLADQDVSIVNASRWTAIRAIPHVALKDALNRRAA